MPKNDIIQSLDKGLSLLEIVEQATHPVTLHYLWGRLKWDKATIFRMLRTLERRGYLLRDDSRKEYSLGPKIYGLYSALLRELDLQKMAKPLLKEISSKYHETAHLAVSVGDRVVFIDRSAVSNFNSINTQIGASEPTYCTAVGKAMIAFIGQDDLGAYLPKSLTRYTTKTIVGLPALTVELHEIQSRGYAVDNEEYIDGIRCVAAPIFNDQNAPIAAIGISAPVFRLPLEKLEKCGEDLKEKALGISKRFGFHDGHSSLRNRDQVSRSRGKK
jgi:DNA-binding IclR family transcriptional regulator